MHCHWVVLVVLSLLGWTVGDVMVSSRFSNADCTGIPTSVVTHPYEEGCVASSCIQISSAISEKRECKEKDLHMPGYIRVEQHLTSPCTKDSLAYYSDYDHTGSCYHLNGRYTLFQCDHNGNVLAAECSDSMCTTGCMFINAPGLSECLYSNGSYVSFICNADITTRRQLRVDDFVNILFNNPECSPLALTLTGTAPPFGLELSPLVPNSLAQQWTIDGNGFIINRQEANQALDIFGYSSVAGTPVGLWDKKVAYQTSANQQWTISYLQGQIARIQSQLATGLHLTPVFSSVYLGSLEVDYTPDRAIIQSYTESVDSGCSEDAVCTNVGATYFCECNSGFTGAGTICEDYDECANNDTDCSDSASCTNNIGSYSCQCNPGFEGDGFVCQDINECLNDNDCSEHSTCENTIGSYACSCADGYTGDGNLCEDINECVSVNDCSLDGTCFNIDGSYECECNPGYIGNGTDCQDDDECLHQNLCSADATCENRIGYYHCACNSGFIGDGWECADIDECANAANNNCSSNAKCTNIVGSYTCNCNPGFVGDGISCAKSCPAFQTFNASSGIISSNPNSSTYTINTTCEFLIYGDRVYLDVTQINTQLGRDYLELADGPDMYNVIYSLSGPNLPRYQLVSSRGAIRVRFTSDNAVVNTGFVATYQTFNQSCRPFTTYTTTSGTIFSNSTLTYPSGCACRWLLLGTRITLTITSLDLVANDEYLAVYDGTNAAAPEIFRGTRSSKTIGIGNNSHAMFVVFYSKVPISRGFVASFTRSGTIEPMGCYRYGLDGPTAYSGGDDMTPSKCIERCSVRYYKVAGVGEGWGCWCGDTIPSTVWPYCNLPCVGDPSVMCGGHSYLNIYRSS